MTADGGAPDENDQIELYLDELLGRLHGSPRQVRRTLAETEDHLREATSEGIALGMTPRDAARRAIERLGDPRVVAGGRSIGWVWTPVGERVRQLIAGAAMFMGIGLVAIGLSNLFSLIVGALFGARSITGDRPGQVYSAADCAHWLAGEPAGTTCAQAAISDHVGDLALIGVAALVAGAAILLVFAWLRRRRHPLVTSLDALPAELVPAIGATTFGVVGALLVGQGVDSIMVGIPAGAGLSITQGLAALFVAAVFAVRLLHDLLGGAGSAALAGERST